MLWQLELGVPCPGRGDTAACSVIFPAGLLLLTKGSFARWCVLTAGLSSRVSPFSAGSFPLVLDQFPPPASI